MIIKDQHKNCLKEAAADDLRGHFELRVNSTAAWVRFAGIPLFDDVVEYRYVPYKDPTPIPFDLQSFTERVHARALIYVRPKNTQQRYHLVTSYLADGLTFCGQFFSWSSLAAYYEWADSADLGVFCALEWKSFTR